MRAGCPFGDCLAHFFGDYLAPRDVAPLAAQGPVRRLRHQPTARAPSTDQNSAPDNSQNHKWASPTVTAGGAVIDEDDAEVIRRELAAGGHSVACNLLLNRAPSP